MKKLISILLMISVLLSLGINMVFSDDEKYPIPEVYEEYLTEDIDNYFLPQGYDIRFSGLSIEEQEKVYLNEVEHDGEGKIIVPPMVSYAGTTWQDYPETIYDMDSIFTTVFYFNALKFSNSVDEQYKFTSAMLRTLCLGNESAIRSFVAPWTLYNAKTGELYTWNELMAMTDSELENLEFETPDFEKFITNIKNELLLRGWWKDEYQTKYDMLYSHKDDYKNTLDENESFLINGETYNFATMNYEFSASKIRIHSNITCINIFTDEFKNVFTQASSDIKEKYSEMFNAIKIAYEQMGARDYYDSAYQIKYHDIVIDGLSSLTENQKNELKSEDFPLFSALYKYNVSEEELKQAIIDYNFSVSVPWATFGDVYCAALFDTEDKWEAISMITTEGGLVVNENEFIVLNMYDILPFPGINVFEEYVDKIEEYDKIIVQLEEYANKLVENSVPSSIYSAYYDAIEYLKTLRDEKSPSTGENTALYIAIASAAVVCMTALLVRKKRGVL